MRFKPSAFVCHRNPKLCITYTCCVYSFCEAFHLFADRPDTCSSAVMVPECQVTVNGQDVSKLNVLIMLPNRLISCALSDIGFILTGRYKLFQPVHPQQILLSVTYQDWKFWMEQYTQLTLRAGQVIVPVLLTLLVSLYP